MKGDLHGSSIPSFCQSGKETARASLRQTQILSLHGLKPPSSFPSHWEENSNSLLWLKTLPAQSSPPIHLQCFFDLISSILLAHLATLASFLFLKLIPAPGPLHLLLPLPGTLFLPLVFAGLSQYSDFNLEVSSQQGLAHVPI